MPKSKHPDHEDEHERKHRREHEHGEHPHREHEESGDDPKRHAKIIEQRWLGSAPPTPERYARALQQWQKLPGAVVRPAASVTVQPEKPKRSETKPTHEGAPGHEGHGHEEKKS